MMDKVILVDEKDNKIGVEKKIASHKKGLLHRAFSVFVFNKNDRLLLQKRASCKYHSAGLWTNTCCGHPRPDEDTKSAEEKRLTEEMGIGCSLKEVFTFSKKVQSAVKPLLTKKNKLF